MVRALGLLLIVAWACDAAAQPPQEQPRADRASSAGAPPVRSMSAPKRVWEVSFPNEISMEEYARQLDFFKIEIAAVSKRGKVEYIQQVSKRKPEKRMGRFQQDYRLSIPWKSGTLHAVDRKLLYKAGISSTSKELSHFFSNRDAGPDGTGGTKIRAARSAPDQAHSIRDSRRQVGRL